MSVQWWKGNKKMKNPSKLKIDAEDLDDNSYRSAVTGALIDTVVAKKMHKFGFTYDHLTEKEAEDILQEIDENPVNLTIKTPYVKGGKITADFRCSKWSIELYKDDDDSEEEWAELTFNLVQKKKAANQ